MMHSSTDAGSMPARRTASAMTSAPSCDAVKRLQRPEKLPGRRADGGDDHGFAHDASFGMPIGVRSPTSGSRRVTSRRTSPSSSVCSRRRITGDDRRISRTQWLVAASTSSTLPSRRTAGHLAERGSDRGFPGKLDLARATAAPRAAVRQRRRASLHQSVAWRTDVILSFSASAIDPGIGLPATSRTPRRGRFHVRDARRGHRRARAAGRSARTSTCGGSRRRSRPGRARSRLARRRDELIVSARTRPW